MATSRSACVWQVLLMGGTPSAAEAPIKDIAFCVRSRVKLESCESSARVDILIIHCLTLLRQSFIFSRPTAFVNVPAACAGCCFVADIFMNALGDRHASEMQLFAFYN